MAGDWIKMRADLFTHPKVFRVAELLNKDELFTVGALFCFWAWADKHCVDGHVDGATSRLIDRATRVDGLSDALIAVGWLELDEEGARIPRFEEHNGDSAKERSLKNQRQARWRAGKAAKDVDGEASTKASTQSTTKPSTREEKRREEIDTSPDGDVGKPAAAGVSDQCPHQQIIELYHQHLPMARRVREWTAARQQTLRSRWREKPKRQNLEWWGRFFAYVAESDFLTGKVSTPGRKPFELSLDWLLKAENFTKVIEGAYENAPAEASA